MGLTQTHHYVNGFVQEESIKFLQQGVIKACDTILHRRYF